MADICDTCQKRESIVQCSNCEKHNCGTPIGCCHTFKRSEKTITIVCHDCYNIIIEKLIPYPEISDKLRIIKKKANQKYLAKKATQQYLEEYA